MFKSLFFALFWHLWLCWRASYFISDHLLLKNLLRTLNSKSVNYWKLFHHTTFFSLMNHKIFPANKSKQIEQIKFRIQTIYLFTDLHYASTIVTITLLTIRINRCWKWEETIFALRTCSLVYIVLTWTLAGFLVTAEAAIPCTITVAAAFCKGKHTSLTNVLNLQDWSKWAKMNL